MLTLIKGGQVYAPDKLGEQDVLLGGKEILAMDREIAAPAGIETEIVDATGLTVIPGYIDSHMHLLGGGGSVGPESRTHEVDISTLAKAGLTTVVGTLGISPVSYTLKHLLISAMALENWGLSTYIYTGAMQLPSVTFLDSVLSDLSLIDKVVGVKIALFDTLCSHPSLDTLKELASKVWLGGRLGGKAGLIHAHLGETGGSLREIADLLKWMGLPPAMLVATHVNRTAEVLEMCIEGGLSGVSLDVTALYTPDNGLPETVAPAEAYRRLRAAKVPAESLTMSSDGNSTQTYKNEHGVVDRFMLTPANAVAAETAKAVLRDGLALEEILPLSTINAARRLRIDHKKGSLEPGKDADVVLLDRNLEVDTVYAKGKLMLKQKEPVVVGYFEKGYAKLALRDN